MRFLTLGVFVSSILLLSAGGFSQPYSKYLFQKADGGTVTYFNVRDCDKDGAIVAARDAGARCGVSETGTLPKNADLNLVDNTFFQRRCSETCSYYQNAGLGTNPLLMNKNVVMGSVHELGLYLAEAMHGQFLPLEFLGFADTWARVKSAPGIRIAMSDYDVGNRFWVWCKMANQNDVPNSYLSSLSQCENLFIVRSTETEEAYSFIGKCDGCYIHSSVNMFPYTRNIVSQLQVAPLPTAERLALRQHEWGLPDATITMMRELWVKKLRKNPNNFRVVEGGTVQLFCAIPSVWERYLNDNARKIEGITCNAYWIAHPSYERRYNLIPFHWYRYKDSLQEWAPFDAIIMAMVNRYWQNNGPFIVTSFVNNIGSATTGPNTDVEELHRFLAANNLGPNNPNINSFFCVGVDYTGTVCTGYDGEVLDDIPATKVRKWLAERPGTTADKQMQPLLVSAVVAVLTSFGVVSAKLAKL